MSMQQQQVLKDIKRRDQKNTLLIEVRAKAFELQRAISDLLEYGSVGLNAPDPANKWMKYAEEIYSEAGNQIKGA